MITVTFHILGIFFVSDKENFIIKDDQCYQLPLINFQKIRKIFEITVKRSDGTHVVM